jgi:cyclic pyranopterin phosphate synthase
MDELTHFDEAGRARMVDVSAKADTSREALAAGEIVMQPETLARIRAGRMAKGDVLAVAQVAGIMAAKQTPQIIPLCHTLLLTGVELAFTLDEAQSAVLIRASVRTTGKTGAEMEALTAVSAAALTIYDMCKAVDRGMSIQNIRLLRKSGGKSGTFEREADAPPAPPTS